jgi:hypothetical protein
MLHPRWPSRSRKNARRSSFRGAGFAREPGTHMWTAPGSQGRCSCDGLVGFGHMSGLCGAVGFDRWPRWVARIGSLNMHAMSEPCWISRGVPILGSTDRHLAALLANARLASGARRASSGRLRLAMEFAAHHHGPQDAGHLVGQRNANQLSSAAAPADPKAIAMCARPWRGGCARWRRAPAACAAPRRLAG